MVACLSRLTIDHASLSRLSTVLISIDTSNILALTYVFSIHHIEFAMHHIETFALPYGLPPLPVSPLVATIHLLV